MAHYRPEFAFRTWLLRVATNHCTDFIRRRKLKTYSLGDSVFKNGVGKVWQVRDYQPDPQESYIRQQRRELVRRVVAQLPPPYARLLVLRYFQELSYAEVAAQLQVPLGTVKAQLFRARLLI